MSDDDRVIHSFQQRRQVDAALAALAAAANEAELIAAARSLVQHFPPDLLLTALPRHLGTASSQLRGGLGHLCALLPPEDAGRVLHAAAANRNKSPQERTAAALILERYLGDTTANALIQDLAGNEEAPLASLREAIEDARRDRYVLLEYVTQMQEHGTDVAFMVMGMLDRLPAGDRIDLLRLIAQDERPQVARSALDRLVVLAAGGTPGAARALYALHATLPEPFAGQADRALRKLQFGGNRYHPPAPERWRALISAADAGGYLSVWLVREPSTAEAGTVTDDGAMLGLVISLARGIAQFYGSEQVQRAHLPAPHAVGTLVDVGTTGEETAVLLEVPFAVGRWLALQAAHAQQRQEPLAPLPAEYKLRNDLIWEYETPQIPRELQELLARPAVNPSETTDPPDDLETAVQTLLAHPALGAWLAWGAAVWSTLDPLPEQQKSAPPVVLISLLLREMARVPNAQALIAGMAAGLHALAIWFWFHEDRTEAEQSARLAAALPPMPIAQNPLLAALLAETWPGIKN